MLEIFRWLKGFVEFQIIGKFPERFINVVTSNGVSIWNTAKCDDTLCARMYIKDYKRVRYYARKSMVKLRIKSKHGFPFFVKRYKSRVGVLVGIAVFIIVVLFMSNFVWTIEVVGLNTVSEARVLESLKENGLYVGTYKPSTSFTAIARKTMLDLEDIGWMAVNVLDSHARVEVKEKAKKPKVPDYKQPANVKAKRDGLILSINTAEGDAYFGSGSAVVKDQLLVSCVIEDQLGGVKFVRADAQIIARTLRDEQFSVPKKLDTVLFSNVKSGKSFSLFSVDIPIKYTFASAENCAVRRHSNKLKLFDSVLPLSLETENYYKLAEKKIKLNKEKALSILKNKSALYECFELSDCKILSREYDFKDSKDRYVMNVVFECEEDIAYQQNIDVDRLEIEDELPKKENRDKVN